MTYDFADEISGRTAERPSRLQAALIWAFIFYLFGAASHIGMTF